MPFTHPAVSANRSLWMYCAVLPLRPLLSEGQRKAKPSHLGQKQISRWICEGADGVSLGNAATPKNSMVSTTRRGRVYLARDANDDARPSLELHWHRGVPFILWPDCNQRWTHRHGSAQPLCKSNALHPMGGGPESSANAYLTPERSTMHLGRDLWSTVTATFLPLST